MIKTIIISKQTCRWQKGACKEFGVLHLICHDRALGISGHASQGVLVRCYIVCRRYIRAGWCGSHEPIATVDKGVQGTRALTFGWFAKEPQRCLEHCCHNHGRTCVQSFANCTYGKSSKTRSLLAVIMAI